MTTSSSSLSSDDTAELVIKFFVSPTFNDYLRVQRGMIYRQMKFAFWLAAFLAIMFILIPLLPMYSNGQSIWQRYWSMRMAFIFPAFMLVVLPLLLYFAARRTWNRSAETHEQRTIELSDKEVTIRGASFDWTTAWSNIVAAIRIGDQIVLTTTQRGAYILPLKDQPDAIRSAVFHRITEKVLQFR